MGVRCMICGGEVPATLGAAFRVNAKGKPGLWACESHFASARAYFPDDNPTAPVPDEADDTVSLGPWSGGTRPTGETP